MRTGKKLLMVVLGAGLLLALSVMAVAAAPSVPGPVPNDIPATAQFVDGMSHPIAANSSLWYKFDSGTDTRNDAILTYLTLTNGTNSGVTFDVYSGSQIANWWDNTPVGRGTSQGSFGVMSDNLTWAGKFNGNGVQYIRVINTNAFATDFTLAQSQPDSRS
jgi:hypothetical protein